MLPRALTLILLSCVACGDDVSAPVDAGADSLLGDADAAVAAPGHRIGFFGPAPSFFELFATNEARASTDAFHLGGHRTGFTWPIPFAGDFDGDGFDGVGFFDPRAAEFHIDDEDGGVTIVRFGAPQRIPLVGDWDGDGDDELGTYDPVTGEAVLADDDLGILRTVMGPAGRAAIAADSDGDGIDEIVYYDGSAIEVLAPSTLATTLDAPANGYPFAFDRDGDGVDGIGLLDLATQTFRLFDSLADGASPEVLQPPVVNWVRFPVAGRWRAAGSHALSAGYGYERVDPASVGIDGARLDEAARALEAMPNLRSFLVLKAGALAHESYFHGNRAEIAHNIKSVSKSILSTIYTMARAEGVIPDVPVVSLLPPSFDDGDPRRGRIMSAHLLTMTSGLSWREDLIADWYVGDDWAWTAFTAPMTSEPGESFNYSTGTTHVASTILAGATGTRTDDHARAHLLEPLGIVAERWDRDPAGGSIGGAEVTMRPRDLARFGQLYLEDGAPDGTRVVDEVVIEAIRTEYVPATSIDGDLRYGAWWWMRTFGSADAYFAWGYGGQFVFVFPSLDAVVVVTSRSDVDGATSTAVSYSVFSVITDHVVPALGG